MAVMLALRATARSEVAGVAADETDGQGRYRFVHGGRQLDAAQAGHGEIGDEGGEGVGRGGEGARAAPGSENDVQV